MLPWCKAGFTHLHEWRVLNRLSNANFGAKLKKTPFMYFLGVLSTKN
jgi:hypothetical protein